MQGLLTSCISVGACIGALLSQILSDQVWSYFGFLFYKKIRWSWMDFYLQWFIMCNINYLTLVESKDKREL